MVTVVETHNLEVPARVFTPHKVDAFMVPPPPDVGATLAVYEAIALGV